MSKIAQKSLSNGELEKEVEFWRNLRSGYEFLGGRPVGNYMPPKSPTITAAGENLIAALAQTGTEVASLNRSLGARGKAISPNRAATGGTFAFVTFGATVSDWSLTDMEDEVKRRGQLGTMSRLESERYQAGP